MSIPMDCWWVSRTTQNTAWQIQRLEPTNQGWQAHSAQLWTDFLGSAEHLNSLTMPSTLVLINLPDEPCTAQGTPRWCTVRQSPVRWHAVDHSPALAGLIESLQHYPAGIRVVCESHYRSGPDSAEYVQLLGHEHPVFEQWAQGLNQWPPTRLAWIRFNTRQVLLSRKQWPLRTVLATIAVLGIWMGSAAQQMQGQQPVRASQLTAKSPPNNQIQTPKQPPSTSDWQGWKGQLEAFGARGKKHIESVEFDWKDGVPTTSIVQLDRIPRRLPKGCTEAAGAVVCTPANAANPSGVQP
ncbi:MAG TPA: hypothetical protein VGE55_01475 [Limnobacter sp.]|uniref:hypothetical protein n=1 Tax=Limnobacter sp. TaxID=2003368 RepID=UPI002ED9CD91